MSPRSFRLHPSLIPLGEAVRSLRKERGMTQKELAEKAGTNVAYIGHVEHARRNLTWSALNMICEGLGVTRSELVERVERLERKD